MEPAGIEPATSCLWRRDAGARREVSPSCRPPTTQICIVRCVARRSRRLHGKTRTIGGRRVLTHTDSGTATESGAETDRAIRIVYTNCPGETSLRRIVPQHLWFGATERHPEEQSGGPLIHPDAPRREHKVSDPRYALHNLHTIGWVLAFERVAGRFVRAWHGPSHPVARPRVPRLFKEDREWVNLGPAPPDSPRMAIHGLRFPRLRRREPPGVRGPRGRRTHRARHPRRQRHAPRRRLHRDGPHPQPRQKPPASSAATTASSAAVHRPRPLPGALKERLIVVFVCEDGDQALEFLKLADTQGHRRDRRQGHRAPRMAAARRRTYSTCWSSVSSSATTTGEATRIWRRSASRAARWSSFSSERRFRPRS
jgi:hypothetical protein